MKKLCPINKFKECKKEYCAWSVQFANKDGEVESECSIRSMGHMDFTLGAIVKLQNERKEDK